MLKRWEKKLDLLAPLTQAERCLEQWLKEEGRAMTPRQKQRAVALMARYFHHEEDVTDALMLSFLRHYSGSGEIDMEDPTSVRMELKTLLDKSREVEGIRRPWLIVNVLVILGLCSIFVWHMGQQKITREQQEALKSMVQQVVAKEKGATTAAGVWSEIKDPLKVRSYQDITRWQYGHAMKVLEKRRAGE